MIRTRELHRTDLQGQPFVSDRSERVTGAADAVRSTGSGGSCLAGAAPAQDAPADERTSRWLNRARALGADGAWRRVLGLANRGQRRGIRHPNLMALGGEAALHVGRPAEAIRLICWAQRAGLEERRGALSLLKGEALARLGARESARRWLNRARLSARQAGALEIEARAVECLAGLPETDGTGGSGRRPSAAQALSRSA